MKDKLRLALDACAITPELVDLHIHTSFCDGKDTPEEMVNAAVSAGLRTVGIVTHSYVEFDKDYSISPERIAEFHREISRLKEKYKDKISLFIGLEEDLCSSLYHGEFDYKIGSVHYLNIGGTHYSVDADADGLIRLCQNHFGGDFSLLAEEYFKKVGELAQRDDIDIIGHFDLITKFNENDSLFSTSDERYVNACRNALDKLIAAGKRFEINFGAITRGYRKTPYPSRYILDYIKEHGGKTIYSSDAHKKENIKKHTILK